MLRHGENNFQEIAILVQTHSSRDKQKEKKSKTRKSYTIESIYVCLVQLYDDDRVVDEDNDDGSGDTAKT